MKRLCYGVWVLLCLAGVSLLRASAETRTWNGPATGDWFAAANWLPNDQYPQAGDTVVIATGSALLTNETAELAAFSITNATLVFSNWTTRLRATTVTIWNNGMLTLPGAFTEAQMSNRVWVVCTDLELKPGGVIDVSQRGYAANNGLGKGSKHASNQWYLSGGGGYGGWGGRGVHSDGTILAGGSTYGAFDAPLAPGSGGGNYNSSSPKAGGGAVFIQAGGTLVIDGVISADGGDSANINAGAGSGGSINIICDQLAGGTSGVVRANGGYGTATGSYGNGGGGGGRIAVRYSTLAETVGVRFSARYGSSYDSHWGINRLQAARIGTIYFSSPNLIEKVLTAWNGNSLGVNGEIRFESTNRWESAALNTLSNSAVGIADGNLWQISSALSVREEGVLLGTGATLRLEQSAGVSNAMLLLTDHAVLQGDSDLLLAPGGGVRVFSGATNDGTPSYGALIDVAGDLVIASNGWIYPVSNPTNGGSLLVRAQALDIARYGGINANGLGFGGTYGPGKGTTSGSTYYSSGGGGYGGRGGTGYDTDGGGRWASGGVAYGNENALGLPGSGGGGQSSAGGGGGLIRMEIRGNITLDGTLSANGGSPSGNRGAGSGGGIYVMCGAFYGTSNSLVSAVGANGATNATEGAGGGGGGRIAVWVQLSTAMRDQYLTGVTNRVYRQGTHRYFEGTATATNGSGWVNAGDPQVFPAQAGTVWFFTSALQQGTILSIF